VFFGFDWFLRSLICQRTARGCCNRRQQLLERVFLFVCFFVCVCVRAFFRCLGDVLMAMKQRFFCRPLVTLSIYNQCVFARIFLSIYLSIYLFMYLSIFIYIYRSFYVFIYIF
jgi:hypothetical protein